MEYTNYHPCENIEKACKEITKKHKLFPLITIEGTDCSGKQTQSEMLIEKLNKIGINATRRQYPNYDSPTGYIIGSCYLGKPHLGGQCVFPEGPNRVDPIVATHLYAADRYNDKYELTRALVGGVVVLDRYIESNIAYQAGLISDKKERKKITNYIIKLEYGLNKLRRADIKILIYMPLSYTNLLKKKRNEVLDKMEQNEQRLLLAERAYLEMAKKMKFKIINCIKADANLSTPKLSDIKTPSEISEELFNFVMSKLKIKA